MFDGIAARYDLVNTILSAGTDAGWRRRAARATGIAAGGSALDIACGSGRLTAELSRIAGPGGRVLGLDFSAGMLSVARQAHPDLPFLRGDAHVLPFRSGGFEATTMAFGLRNLERPVQGLSEMMRVVRGGGRAVVLEFLRPPRTLPGRAYRLYLRTALPVIGGLISGRPAAYRYLSDTVDSYHTPEELRALAAEAGWRVVHLDLLSMGTVGILSGSP
jgi:demethylmenaquinone methyltransferase/2-methoxy-6-polyprenyl-1,4-benzoquinol methylase